VVCLPRDVRVVNICQMCFRLAFTVLLCVLVQILILGIVDFHLVGPLILIILIVMG